MIAFRDITPFQQITPCSDPRAKKRQVFSLFSMQFLSLLAEFDELLVLMRLAEAEKRDLYDAFEAAGSEITTLQARIAELEGTIQTLKACPAFGYIAELSPTWVMSNYLMEREERARIGELAIKKAEEEYSLNKSLFCWVNDYQI